MPALIDTTYLALKSPAALAEAMDAKKMTVRGLAAATGLKPAMIGHLRSGRNQRTAADNARAISAALDTDLAALWGVRDGHLLAATPGGNRA